jgi:ubiquinone biosynthesis protein COQ9
MFLSELIENLQRADLNPIDMARALLEFYKSRHGDVALADVVNRCILLERDRERLEEAVVDSLSTIQTITGKSIRSAQRLLAFLKAWLHVHKLPDALRIFNQQLLDALNL